MGSDRHTGAPLIPGVPCGVNADWIGRAWYVRGPVGGANRVSGGIYLVEDDERAPDDPRFYLLRRWYVADGFSDPDGNDIIEDLTPQCATLDDCLAELASIPLTYTPPAEPAKGA